MINALATVTAAQGLGPKLRRRFWFDSGAISILSFDFNLKTRSGVFARTLCVP